MNFISGKTHIPNWVFLVGILLIIACGLGLWLYRIDDAEVKLIGLVGGIVSGLVVFVLTFLTLLRPLRKLDSYQRMGIRGLLSDRHDKPYYQEIVARAESKVRVTGASCTRFVDDFMDPDSDHNRALIDALRAHAKLSVQILIPEAKFMSPGSSQRAAELEQKIAKLQEEFSQRIELRRFPDRAQHSFVIADDDLIAGPIFESDKSKYAPAVHVSLTTPFGRKYNDHFEAVWAECGNEA